MSLEKLESLFQKFYQYRELKDQLEKEVKDINQNIGELESEILTLLDQSGKKNWELPEAKFYVSEKESYTNPKDPEKMKEFRTYLFENGLEDMLTVHSMKLNSWAHEEMESAKARGDAFFKIPGLDLPTTYKKLNMRRK